MPTDEEVLKETGYAGGMEGAISLSRVKQHVSLSAPLDENNPNAGCFGDKLVDTNSQPLDLLLDVRVKFETVAKDLRELTLSIQSLDIPERSKEMFFRYYGLNGNPSGATLEEIGSSIDLTRERVRQIIVKIWDGLDDNKVEYDDVILMKTLWQLAQIEMLVGEKADLIPRETDQSLLLDLELNKSELETEDDASALQ